MALDLSLEDKVALVTGGTSGIGKAICEALLSKGAWVYTCGRKEEKIKAIEGHFAHFGDRFRAMRCHVAKGEEVEGLLGKIGEEKGRLDILVNNVGMNVFTPFLLDTDPGLWDKIMETNLKSAFLVTSKALPLLKASLRARIINISSIAGKRPAPGMGVYCVSKAGLDMLTKVMASELASLNISVNAVAPGVVRTDFSRPLWGDPETLKEIEAGVPFGRIAEVDEVAGTVLFLASPLSDYLTGEILVVDGGALLR